ncbi:MAG: type VI secretion system baseplate subunit TssF [Herminiimonas sp.]|nr:type VI secretion system baseplate subunit TssF [Herminiimonas sp.]
MNPRLLQYYNSELAYLREMGQEFAQQYPKIAGRLGIHEIDVADPYVERLLEGFSFLTARIQLKMDAEFPRFSQRLLDILYPNYLAPTPAMAIAQVKPRMPQGSVGAGFTIPRHSSMMGGVAKGEQTACEFRTAHALTLWPLEIVDVSCTGAPADLPLAALPLERDVKGAIRIRLKAIGAAKLAALDLDSLSFFLSGSDGIASQLYEHIFAHALGFTGTSAERPSRWIEFRDACSIQPEGFDAQQAMLPYDTRSFQGYRLLHEYFAFSTRYQFFRLEGLQTMVRQASGDILDLTILLDCPVGKLENLVDQKQLALFCTPVVNLFPKRGDRLALGADNHDHHIVVDRTRPLDFEVHAVTGIVGHHEDATGDQTFRPFYSSFDNAAQSGAAYFSTRREPRVLSDSARRAGTRTAYIGSEVFLSLVDCRDAPYRSGMRHLSVDTMCTNRDLPLLMPIGSDRDLALTASAPIDGIRIVRGPSAPSPAMAEEAITWRLISHLNLNYLSLTDIDNAEQAGGATALRELLSLYAALSDSALSHQVGALQGMRSSGITRRLPQRGPIVFGRGVGIELTVDESLFAGSSPYIFGAILEQFLARHVSVNVFTETTLRSLQRGVIGSWRPRIGNRPIA